MSQESDTRSSKHLAAPGIILYICLFPCLLCLPSWHGSSWGARDLVCLVHGCFPVLKMSLVQIRASKACWMDGGSKEGSWIQTWVVWLRSLHPTLWALDWAASHPSQQPVSQGRFWKSLFSSLRPYPYSLPPILHLSSLPLQPGQGKARELTKGCWGDFRLPFPPLLSLPPPCPLQTGSL